MGSCAGLAAVSTSGVVSFDRHGRSTEPAPATESFTTFEGLEMQVLSFRVSKFRNIVDSGQIAVDPAVTCLVGVLPRNNGRL